MAGNISDFLEKELLDHSLSVGAFTMPTNLYVGLFTADPGDDYSGSGDEVSTATEAPYVRQSATMAAAAGAAATSSNSADITWPAATNDWGNISHIALFDSSDGSGTEDMLWHGSLTANKSISSGDTFKISSADLDVSLD